jgi:putative nucleotide binding protein
LEDFAHLLDYLPQGLPGERTFRREPLAYALGESEFKLFELVPKPNTQMTIGQRVYIGKEAERRAEILHVQFYNEAQAITTRFHMLELLPGLGKKTMWSIIEEKKKGKFASFEDMAKRITSVKHPEKLIAKRIEIELSDPGQKYHLFVAR